MTRDIYRMTILLLTWFRWVAWNVEIEPVV